MANKTSFIMYKSWGKAVEKMTDEQAGQLLKACFEYQTNPDAEPEDAGAALVWEIIKQKFDEDSDKYEEKCKARSEAGKRGMEKRWGVTNGTEDSQPAEDEQKSVTKTANAKDGITKITNASFVNHEITNITESESESESDNESDKDKKGRGERKALSSPRPPKHKHGQYGHIMLTDAQYESLLKDHTEAETAAAIQAVDDYCEQYGKHYSNYALAIRKWGFKAAAEHGQRDRPGAFDANDYLMGIINGGEA